MTARYQPPGSTPEVEHFVHVLHRSTSYRFFTLLAFATLCICMPKFDRVEREQLHVQQYVLLQIRV